jgi:hypothetical protein
MGRGLSELQKRILTVVYERRLERDFEHEERDWRERTASNPYMKDWPYWVRFDMRHPQILAALYDWPLYWSWRDKRYVRPSDGGQVHDRGSNFRRRLIGFEEYNRRTAAYYRAVNRLKRRGLLTNRGAGLWMTDEGMRVAEGLSVRKVAASPSSNR